MSTTGSRTIIEYLVMSIRIVTRDDGTVVHQTTKKHYRSLKAVDGRIGRLTSPEPWRYFGSMADRERSGDERGPVSEPGLLRAPQYDHGDRVPDASVEYEGEVAAGEVGVPGLRE